MQSWQTFKTNFNSIIKNTKHYSILQEITSTPNNILLYSVYGFPIDILIDEIIKSRCNLQTIYRNKIVWNRTVPYIENQQFFEVDLMHPDIHKDYSFLTELVLHIVQIKNIANDKHLFIIKHIELLHNYFFEFRILLERYSANVVFLCTTHSISQLEEPIRSRFSLFRIPLFATEEIDHIFTHYIQKTTPANCRRNIIKALFFADVPVDDVSTYNFPPLYDFIKKLDMKKNNLEDIRTLAFKCCQYNINIMSLVADLLKILDDNTVDIIHLKIGKQASQKKYQKTKEEYTYKIITLGANIDHCIALTSNCREPIYIESFLCQILLL